jgi:ribosomal protein S18 acetylase RimI-like enzyme
MLAFDTNPGLNTDLLLHAQTARVEEHEGYIVVLTPEAPEYFFGNMLVLPQRPSLSDLPRIERDFARLVGEPPRIVHRAYTWPEFDDGPVCLDDMVAQGYELSLCNVLTATSGEWIPARLNHQLKIRRFRSQDDWDVWSTMQLANMPNPADITSQRFIAHQQRAFKVLIERGMGDWWGAFLDGAQVGSLGLFFFDGIARFQSVLTVDTHRNRGVCRTLISEVLKAAQSRANQFVMVADESYHAGRIYRALGFRPQARLGSLCWQAS